MPRITGGKAHAARLKFMTSPEARQQVGAALYVGGQLIEVAAAVSITNGAVSGKGHVPSFPGEPPNNDTGVLARNIETAQVRDEGGVIRVEVSSNAPYSAHLEYGTSKMAARPFMAPAAQAKRLEVKALIRRATAYIAKGGRVG